MENMEKEYFEFKKSIIGKLEKDSKTIYTFPFSFYGESDLGRKDVYLTSNKAIVLYYYWYKEWSTFFDEIREYDIEKFWKTDDGKDVLFFDIDCIKHE